MKNLKICLIGKARSGKDTVAEFLESEYGMVPFAFGDELKKDFHTEYPHIEKVPKPVKGYQLYGQLKRYVHGENYWVDSCFKKIEQIEKIAYGYDILSDHTFMPLITDVRQENELRACKDREYVTIRINCPEHIRIQRMKDLGDHFEQEVLTYSTETEMDNFEVDFEVCNDGSILDLRVKIRDIVKTIQGG